MRTRRIATVTAAVVAGLVLLTAAFVVVLTNSDWGREQVRTRLLGALQSSAHGVVDVSSVSGNLLEGITLHEVRIADSSGAPFLTAARVHTGYALRALLSKRVELSDVLLDSATIVLDRSSNGTWNYARIFPPDTAAAEADTAAGFGDWIVLRDARLVDSRLLVHTPWTPDSTLQGAARDSAIAFALSDKGRTAVTRLPDGTFRQTQDFRRINAVLPLVRLAHPEFSTQLVRTDSLRMEAFAFAPPAADIRHLRGEFELNGDSLWFRDVAVALPASQARLTGRYEFTRGDLALHTIAAPVALNDVRFLYPALPDSGEARADLQVLWERGTQQYVVRELDLTTGATRLRGDLGLTLGDSAADVRLHDTSLEVAALPTSLVETLVPGLDVPREGILNGKAIVSGTATALQVDGDFTFDDVRAGRSRVLAAGELGAANGVFRAEGLRVSLEPLQLSMVRDAAPSLPLGGIISGRAVLDGESDDVLRLRGMDLTHADRSERSRVTGSAAFRAGNSASDRWIDARMIARPLDIRTLGRFAPAAELRGRVAGPIEVVGPWSALAVNAQLRSSEGGEVSARGTLDLASRDIGYALDIRTHLLDMNSLSGKAPRSSLSAFVQTRARGTTPNTLRGTFAADVLASSIDTVAVDSVRVRASIRNGVLQLTDSWIRGPGTLLTANGSFGVADSTSGTLAWSAAVDSLGLLARYMPPADTTPVPPRPLRTADRLAAARRDSADVDQRLTVARLAGEAPAAAPIHVDTLPTIARDSLAGRLRANGEVTGGLGGFDLTGVLNAVGIVAQGSSVRQARAEFGWFGALTDATRYRVQLSADTLLAAGFALDSVSATVEHREPGGTANVSVFQSDDRDYALRASYALFPDRREVTWNNLRLRFDTTVWQTAHAGTLRWGQPGVFIDSLDLRSGANGRVFAHGLVPTEGAADLRLVVNDFQLGDLLGLAQSDLEGRGRIMLNAQVTGSGRAPLIRGEMQLLDARYRETPVPMVTSRFDYAGEQFTARAVLADSARGPDRPVAALDARVPINLAFFDVTGSRLPDAPATADLVADSLPLDLISRVTTALQNVRGSASGRAALRGPVRAPVLTGNLLLREGQAYVTALGITMERINGGLRLVNDTLRLDSLSGWSDGRIALAGTADISTPSKPGVNLTLDVSRARVLDNEQGRLRADAAITARGPFDNIAVEGRAHIRDGVLYIPKSDTREVISAGDPSVFAVIDTSDVATRELVPAQSPLLSNLRMTLTLAVDRDTWVRSADANVEIYSDGDLNILVDRRRSALTLDGVVNTDRGEYQLLGKRFQIKRGAVRFIGTQELNPLLQITGEYEVKQASRPALNINILIGGTLRSPRLTLGSDAQPPISQTDLLSYLAFGNESGSLMQFGSSSLSGGSAGGNLVGTSAALATRQLTGVALGVAVEELEGQAARSLGADVLNITPANVPPELASGNFGALSTFLRGTQFEFGKYLNTRTFLGLQLQATTTPGFRVERQLGKSPGLSLESTFQPRFFLPEPSLSLQEITKANAFGLFLRKRWRF